MIKFVIQLFRIIKYDSKTKNKKGQNNTKKRKKKQTKYLLYIKYNIKYILYWIKAIKSLIIYCFTYLKIVLGVC